MGNPDAGMVSIRALLFFLSLQLRAQSAQLIHSIHRQCRGTQRTLRHVPRDSPAFRTVDTAL